MTPWRLLFVALTVYIIEEIITVLKWQGLIYVPRILNAVFEFVIITIFIYLLLLQKQYISESLIKKKKNAK